MASNEIFKKIEQILLNAISGVQ